MGAMARVEGATISGGFSAGGFESQWSRVWCCLWHFLLRLLLAQFFEMCLGLRQLRQTLLEHTVDNILSRGSALNCGHAYNRCFWVLHREQLIGVSWALAAKDMADLELACLEGWGFLSYTWTGLWGLCTKVEKVEYIIIVRCCRGILASLMSFEHGVFVQFQLQQCRDERTSGNFSHCFECLQVPFDGIVEPPELLTLTIS